MVFRRLIIDGMHLGGPFFLGGREFKMDLGLMFFRNGSHPDRGVRTKVVVTTACATGSVHTVVSHALFSLRDARTSRTRMPQGELSF